MRVINMSNENNNLIIKNNQVQIYNYFDSIKTYENEEWINKYFKVLSDPSNLISDKYNIHHIRPCFTFKDKIHKNRKDCKPLADFDENLIKISVYNHILAHFYLWKIFNNKDSKTAFQRMCGQGKYIDNLTEDELKEIAKLKENCAKKNQTKEERKECFKKWYENNKEDILKKNKERYENNKELISEQMKKYNKTHKEQRSEYSKEWYKNHKKERQKYREEHKEKNKKYHEEYYNTHKEKMKKSSSEWIKNHKEEQNKYHKEYSHQICYDPIKRDYPNYRTLYTRIYRNKELYKGIILKNCIL